MSKSPRSAAVEQSRERFVFVDILKQQMLDLKVLRKKVAEAESALAPAAGKGEPVSARRPDGIFVAPFEQGEIGPDLFRHPLASVKAARPFCDSSIPPSAVLFQLKSRPGRRRRACRMRG